jgi:hypothetical protein
VRLGPSDIAWLEASYGDSLLPFLSPQYAAGAGVRLGSGTRLHGGFATITNDDFYYGDTRWRMGGYIGAVASMGNGTELISEGFLIPGAHFWQLLIGVRYPVPGLGQ